MDLIFLPPYSRRTAATDRAPGQATTLQYGVQCRWEEMVTFHVPVCLGLESVVHCTPMCV